MKPGLGSSAGASRGLGVLGTTSFFQHLPSPAPRPPGSGVVAPGDLRDTATAPGSIRPPGAPPRPPSSGTSWPRNAGGPRRVAAGSCSLLFALDPFAFAVPSRNWGLGDLGVPSAPGVTPGGGSVWDLPGLGPPHPLEGGCRSSATSGAWSPWKGAPSWPQQQREPWRGGQAELPALGIIPLLPAWPRGSLGSGFPCQNPKPFISAWGGAGPPPHLSHHEFWVSPAILSSRIPGVWGGGVSITGQRLPGGRAGGGSWCCPPSQKTRDCLWSVEPHRRVCTLQILQQNIF
ncbi:hypothetical protein Nmel_007486 [Mimus melanotis]